MGAGSGQGPRGVSADVVLTASLEPRPGGPAWRALRRTGAVVAELFQGLVPAPSLSDLVVVDRRDGQELLRTPAGDWSDGARLLEHTRAQLREQTVEQFRETWGLTAPAGPVRRTE